MDSNSLCCSLDLVAGSGYTLSVEHRAALQTSFAILKKNYKFNRVLFWGKLLGLNGDYFIAQGNEGDEMKNKKTFYSFNCVEWHLLGPATDAMIEAVSKAARGRFMGDPSHVYECRRQGEGGGATKEEDVPMQVTEEIRLAVTVHQIDEEVSVVPRGAFIKNPQGLVQTNRSFEGLSHTEAQKLDNFFHFTEPKNLKKKSVHEMADLDPSIDFLNPLSDDIPKGCWSLQFECGSNVCVIRSLWWLGLTFFHVPVTPRHGYIYMGDGSKNVDLPFML
ncbi:radial spoke head protein 9 homolog isoform X2 [Lampris incognitus]|uniref:radial spoke head protein 9 homolog isoform X2 n=1 Tax=Lampris incognitus TaxID=2546036 RepID=UPI0024B6334B|nr:radial spoke head protein 9 homolog isoform X2 [Lampris incognitus]